MADSKPDEQPYKTLTFYSTVRRDWWIGLLGGMFPVKNAATASSPRSLRVSIVSWHFAYSVLLITFKTVALIQFWCLIERSLRLEGYTPAKVSDYYAGVLAIIFTYCAGPFVQIVSLYNIKRLVRCLQCLEDYEVKHPAPRPESGRNLRLVFMLLHIVTTNYIPAYGLYYLSDLESLGVQFHIIPWLWCTTNMTVVRIYVLVAFTFLELASLFWGFLIFFPSRTVSLRLEQLLTKAESIATAENGSNDPACRWEAFGAQYADFLRVFKTYQRFAGPFFAATFGVTMTSCTCVIYYILSSRSVPVLEGTGTRPALVLLVLSMIGRFFAMTGCGQAFQLNHRRLVYELMRAYHKEMEKEKEAKRIIKLVTLSHDVVGSLSASGFFTVGRRNITAIASTILTYIVVLYQFSVNDRDDDQQTVIVKDIVKDDSIGNHLLSN